MQAPVSDKPAPPTIPAANRPIIASACDVTRRYRLGNEEVWALRGVSLDIYQGEYLSIMGPSGSGKSTFFNMIGALDIPTSGTIRFMGADLFTLPEPRQAWIRCHKIGYIFQTYNLVPVMTALQNVALPRVLMGLDDREANAAATDALTRVGLGHRLHHLPHELSGGQQQRVAIARAIVNNPAMILADEPTGNLDTQTGEEVIKLLRSLQQEQGVTIVTATHDVKMLSISDRIAWIRDGRCERLEERRDIKIQVGGIG